MDYKYILFDLDGTLTESGTGIVNSVCYALEKMGIKVKNREELKKFIGPPLTDSMMKFYGMTKEEAEQAVRYYREYYTDKGIFENEVYDGVRDALTSLKNAGKTLAMATSKPEVYAKKIAQYFEIEGAFTEICGATMDGSRVEKADVIRYTLDKLGIKEEDKGSVLMVGDRSHDILGAKANGLSSMGVLYGYGDRVELEEAGAESIVATAWEVSEKIMEHKNIEGTR